MGIRPFGVQLVGVVAIGFVGLPSCGSPTAPDGRMGVIALRIVCAGPGASPLVCRAETYCSGLYNCPDPSAEGRDVTQEAAWSSADSSVARVVGAGRYEAVSQGDTVIAASVTNATSAAQRPVSVFAGTAPLPTNEIFGSVFEAGKSVATGFIAGAAVEVLDGVIAGRIAVSGVPPQLLPGFYGPFGGPGYYRILGVPPGTYTLRVVEPEYVPQVRTVVVPANRSPSADFEMVRR